MVVVAMVVVSHHATKIDMMNNNKHRGDPHRPGSATGMPLVRSQPMPLLRPPYQAMGKPCPFHVRLPTCPKSQKQRKVVVVVVVVVMMMMMMSIKFGSL